MDSPKTPTGQLPNPPVSLTSCGLTSSNRPIKISSASTGLPSQPDSAVQNTSPPTSGYILSTNLTNLELSFAVKYIFFFTFLNPKICAIGSSELTTAVCGRQNISYDSAPSFPSAVSVPAAAAAEGAAGEAAGGGTKRTKGGGSSK